MSRFATALNTAIEAAGLTAAEVAESAGLTESAISLLRAGRREPSYRTLQRLAHVFPALGEQLADADEGPFDSIEDAIADIRAGKMVVVLDDEDRENEGDLVMAAQMVTPEAINFMRKHAGGLICVPMTGRAARRAAHPADGEREHRRARNRVHRLGRSARQDDDRHLGARSRRHDQRLLDPDARPADFLRPGTRFRCARAKAACSCAPVKPKRRSISRGWRASIRPA